MAFNQLLGKTGMNLPKWISISLAALFLSIIASAFIGIDTTTIVTLFQDDGFGRALLFSLKTSTAATLLAAFMAIPAGLYLSRNQGSVVKCIDALFDIPIVIPPLIVGVLLLSFFNTPLVKEIYDFIFTMPGAIAAQFFIAVPFSVRAAKNGFDLVPQIYEQIAMTLGASPTKAFWDTTFKLALPAINSGLMLSWLRCLGEFGATLMVGGGIPGRTENIPIYIYLNMSSGDFKKGMAASIVVTCCVLIGVLLIRFLSTDKRPEGIE